MTNYIDPEARRPPIAIGPCQCPGTPHDQDYVTIVERFGYGAKGQIREVARRSGPEASNQMVILLGVKEWSFVLPDNSPRPIDAVQVANLPEPLVERLLEDDILGLAFLADEEPLPNGSSALSPSGSPESATSTPTSPAPEPSTTS